MNKAVVIAYEWPGYESGSEIALRSSLLEYCKQFDRVKFVGCGKLSPQPGIADQFGNVEFVRIETKKLAKHYRFLKSLFVSRPAITDEFRQSGFLQQVRSLIDSSYQDGFEFVIFESLTPAVIMDHLKIPDLKYALRSFDVMQMAFDGVGTGLSKYLWDWECRKVKKYENEIARRSKARWAISEQDLEDYINCGVPFDGVMGVAIDTTRYESVPAGDELVATHLGGTDSRKIRGLKNLAEVVWPQVRKKVPNAQLVLGGRGTEDFSNASMGIQGCGFVDDDREFVGRGKITINSQIGGSGIKLKSLNALAASRLLVSTVDGARGVGGESGKHYFMSNSNEEMVENLISALESNHKDMRQAGRQHIQTEFSQSRLEEKSRHLINEFING